MVGAVPRPAGLHELYRLLQQALETTARSSVRIPTNLPVQMRRNEQVWEGSVLSLSENGCLVRTPEPMRLGAELEVAFELPQGGRIETRAESARSRERMRSSPARPTKPFAEKAYSATSSTDTPLPTTTVRAKVGVSTPPAARVSP